MKSCEISVHTGRKKDIVRPYQKRQNFTGTNVRYVDKDHPVSLEDGTVFRPYDTVAEGVNAVSLGGIVSIVTGLYNEVLTINKAMTLTAPVGTVTIASQSLNSLEE